MRVAAAGNSGIVGVGDGDADGVGDAVGAGVDVGVEVGVAVGVGVGIGVGAGVGVGVGAVLVMFTCVMLLPPDPSISKPSEPTITNLGAGSELLGRLVPLTWYANMRVTGWT